MNLIKSMYKRKLTMCFFIIGFMLAILTFSLGTSAIEANEKAMSKVNSKENMMISINNSGDMKITDLISVADKNDIDLKVSTNVIGYDSSNFDMITQLTGEELNISDKFTQGENFNKEDLVGDSKKAIVSEKLKDKKIEYTNILNKETIEFETVAVTDGNGNFVYISKGTFLNLFKDDNIGMFQIFVNGKEENINKFKIELKNEMIKYSKDANINENTNEINDMSLQGKNLYIIAIAIFVITILNSINICALWVKDRVKEISIRKAIGANNFKIFNLMFGELLVISLFSAICALIIQFILEKVSGGELSGVPIELSVRNFAIAAICAVSAALLSALPSVIHLIKIQPSETLREE